MRIRFMSRASRKVIGFMAVCVAAAGLLRYLPFHQRNSKELTGRNIKQSDKLQELFNTPATIPEEYLQNIPNISRHDFKYLISPRDGKLCMVDHASSRDAVDKAPKATKHRKLLILFMVHSKADHFEHRRAIRDTWGSVGKRLTQVVFLLGNPQNNTLQNIVARESKDFGDLIQEDFYETYRNITLKNIMGLKWASQKCPRAKYVVKADDDMFLNSKLMISTLINSRLPRKNLILCKIHFFKNVPREGKYVIDKSMYSADYWPSFCFGGCWIASMDVVSRLYEISLQTKQIYLDDVYVTGILRTKLSLPINYISRAYMIFCHTRGNYSIIRDMWEDLQKNNNAADVSIRKQQPYVKFWTRCFA